MLVVGVAEFSTPGVLLSSLQGAAVAAISIECVLHEFSSIQGVREDVTDIILNIKGLVVSSDNDEPGHEGYVGQNMKFVEIAMQVAILNQMSFVEI